MDRSQTHRAMWWGLSAASPIRSAHGMRGMSGKINVHMRGPDGTTYPMGGVFKKVEKPKRLVFITTAFYDKTGKPMLEVTNTIIFDESYGFTEVTLTCVGHESHSPSRASAGRHGRRMEPKPRQIHRVRQHRRRQNAPYLWRWQNLLHRIPRHRHQPLRGLLQKGFWLENAHAQGRQPGL